MYRRTHIPLPAYEVVNTCGSFATLAKDAADFAPWSKADDVAEKRAWPQGSEEREHACMYVHNTHTQSFLTPLFLSATLSLLCNSTPSRPPQHAKASNEGGAGGAFNPTTSNTSH